MDIPFSSSGAMSRAHYALVRKVETAVSAHAADAVLYAELETIQRRLQSTTMTMKQVQESLVTLLYCHNAIYPSSTLDLHFALPHAISLAEAGKTVSDKRIGYVFCVEIMPRNDELQLMLVNTLRKDLDSSSVSRICLALDTVIHFPPEDVYPAIQDRLYDLLSHISPHIRRRTLLAFRTLSEQSTDILKRILDKMWKRLNDEDHAVVNAALSVSIVLIHTSLMSGEHFHPILTKLFRRAWNSRAHQDAKALLLKVLQAIDTVKPSAEDLEIMQEIVSFRMRDVASLNAVKYQCFRVAAAHSDVVHASVATAFLGGVRHLLVSEEPNDLYTFISCLNCLDPHLWAGSPEIPAFLEGWEVQRVTGLLFVEDQSIRSKTLRLLLRVDRSIVEVYYQKLISNVDTISGGLGRCLQTAEVLSGDDGEAYAQHLIRLLRTASDESSRRHVLHDVVETSLTRIHDAHEDFRSGCLGVLFAILADQREQISFTLLTILTAVICEYVGISPIPPENILKGLAILLPLYPADIQEACLLTMIRVLAKCDRAPQDVVQMVRKVEDSAGRHIKRRIEQFINFSQNRVSLTQLIAQATSPTLPGMLLALEHSNLQQPSQSLPRSPDLSSGNTHNPSRSSSRASSSGGKLRYAAYDAPRLTPRLRRASSSSSRSTDTPAPDPYESLSRTVTAGDLTLATGQRDLQELARSPVLSSVSLPAVLITTTGDLASQVDLLGLDSPFLSEPPPASLSAPTALDFEKMWTTLADANSRGWCEVTIDVVVRKLQSMQQSMRIVASDQSPFLGELKIILTPALGSEHRGIAVLRLKESEDDSCLWQMRCADDGTRTHIRELLTDVE